MSDIKLIFDAAFAPAIMSYMLCEILAFIQTFKQYLSRLVIAYTYSFTHQTDYLRGAIVI